MSPHVRQRLRLTPELIDSLFRVAGQPMAVDTMMDRTKELVTSPLTAGVYDPGSDRIELRARALEEARGDPLGLLVHELGHRALERDSTVGVPNSERAAQGFAEEFFDLSGRGRVPQAAHLERERLPARVRATIRNFILRRLSEDVGASPPTLSDTLGTVLDGHRPIDGGAVKR